MVPAGTLPEGRASCRICSPKILSATVSARLMAGRDERFFRDSKLTGFLLRVRRAAADSTFLTDWFIEQPVPGKQQPAQNQHRRLPDLPGRQGARAGADDVAGDQARRRPRRRARCQEGAAVWEDLVAAFRAKFLPKKEPSTAQEIQWRHRPDSHARASRASALPTSPRRWSRPCTRGERHARRRQQRHAHAVEDDELRDWRGHARPPIPCKGIERYAAKTRDRWLDERELPLFVAALAKKAGPVG